MWRGEIGQLMASVGQLIACLSAEKQTQMTRAGSPTPTRMGEIRLASRGRGLIGCFLGLFQASSRSWSSGNLTGVLALGTAAVTTPGMPSFSGLWPGGARTLKRQGRMVFFEKAQCFT